MLLHKSLGMGNEHWQSAHLGLGISEVLAYYHNSQHSINYQLIQFHRKRYHNALNPKDVRSNRIDQI